ncbi:MAG: septum formation initiator family protein [Cyclobacteriaceae bacterium]
MNFLDRVPKVFKNFYFIVGVIFLLWLLIFDSNDLFTQSRLSTKKKDLEESKEFYEDKILEVKNDREALLTDEEQLEKLAREKYLMKKDSEDVYIIVEETE